MSHEPAGVEPPPALTRVADLVSARLDQVLTAETRRWTDVDADVAAPLTALSDLVRAGGKRLRPAFCAWAHVASGGSLDDPPAVAAGAAIELLHAFALAHDDVMDRSVSRRGQPTAHVRFAEQHRQNAWAGDAGHFGEAVAILIGDLAYAYADRLMAEAGPQVAAVWQEMRIEVNVGQYLDVLAGARGSIDIATARRIIEYKTGRYSVVRPLQLGLSLTGRRPDLWDVLTAYGQRVGTAFQLRDDVLGAFGESESTGKPVGDDLREGKPTLLLAAARAAATAEQAAVLALVGSDDMSGEPLAAVQQVLIDTGALGQIEAEIEQLTLQARTLAADAQIEEPVRSALDDLATYVARRSG